jgi:hypothetical protein
MSFYHSHCSIHLILDLVWLGSLVLTLHLKSVQIRAKDIMCALAYANVHRLNIFP